MITFYPLCRLSMASLAAYSARRQRTCSHLTTTTRCSTPTPQLSALSRTTVRSFRNEVAVMRPVLVVQLGNDMLFTCTKVGHVKFVNSHHFGDTLKKNGYLLRTATDAQAVDWVSWTDH